VVAVSAVTGSVERKEMPVALMDIVEQTIIRIVSLTGFMGQEGIKPPEVLSGVDGLHT
jgi:hypothetical protein